MSASTESSGGLDSLRTFFSSAGVGCISSDDNLEEEEDCYMAVNQGKEKTFIEKIIIWLQIRLFHLGLFPPTIVCDVSLMEACIWNSLWHSCMELLFDWLIYPLQVPRMTGAASAGETSSSAASRPDSTSTASQSPEEQRKSPLTRLPARGS